jgi:CheY-like chemotaxis protein
LLDLLLPRMDGFEFASAVRRDARWLGIPIVVLTAKDLTAEDHERLNGKVQQILSKGEFSRDDLLHEIRRLVSHAAGPELRRA